MFDLNGIGKDDFNDAIDTTTKLMYFIDSPEPTEFFLDVRRMVGYWLQQEMKKLKKGEWYEGAHWIKTVWTYPSFEHLTFAYKNQIFCVLIDIIDEKSKKSLLPQRDKKNLLENCLKNNLVPCLYKVSVKDIYNPVYNTIKPITKGWNLFNAITEEAVIPENIANDKKIEVSEWELNDFAIQIVRDYIQDKLHCKIASYQNVVGVDPQIWFEDNDKNMSYVVVRNVVYPSNRAPLPENIKSLQLSVSSYRGYFASVAFCARKGKDLSKIYRGEGANIVFNGLEKLN